MMCWQMLRYFCVYCLAHPETLFVLFSHKRSISIAPVLTRNFLYILQQSFFKKNLIVTTPFLKSFYPFRRRSDFVDDILECTLVRKKPQLTTGVNAQLLAGVNPRRGLSITSTPSQAKGRLTRQHRAGRVLLLIRINEPKRNWFYI